MENIGETTDQVNYNQQQMNFIQQQINFDQQQMNFNQQQMNYNPQQNIQGDNGLQQAQLEIQPPQQKGIVYKGIIFLTFFFKFIPLSIYFFTSFTLRTEQYIFFVTGCFNGLEFWYTKNIAGRFLAGLVWGSEVDHEGNDKWFFEKEPPKEDVNPVNKFIFWSSLGLSSICWGIYLLWSFMNRSELNVYICLIGAVLANVNLVAFLYCELDIKKKILPLIEEQFSIVYDKMIKNVLEMLKESTKDIKAANNENPGEHNALLENLPNYQEIMKLMGKDNAVQSSE